VPLRIKITGTSFRYLQSLDSPTKKRINEKLDQIAQSPWDTRLSYPLSQASKRCTRVGKYRVLFVVEVDVLIVSDIGPRGEIYRRLKKSK
jgi:mRNA-degrading endonuclease RelE of RelBE toxin-antitoxin system